MFCSSICTCRLFSYFWLLLSLLRWKQFGVSQFKRPLCCSVSKYWVAHWFSARKLQAQAACFDDRTIASLRCVAPKSFVCSCPNWSKINDQVRCTTVVGGFQKHTAIPEPAYTKSQVFLFSAWCISDFLSMWKSLHYALPCNGRTAHTVEIRCTGNTV